MKHVLAVLSLVLLLGAGAYSQEPPAKETPAPEPEYKIPEEAVKRENPVKPTRASIAAGEHLYKTQCAMCHGVKGDGKGDLAEPMKLTLRDWTKAGSLKEYTDGALYYITVKGKGKMPDQQGRMRPNQVWNMINFIRSLAKEEGTKEASPP